MAMKVHELISGDTEVIGTLEDYKFRIITVDGEDEERLRRQMEPHVFIHEYREDKMTASGDYCGCGISGTDKTPFAEMTVGDYTGCIVQNGNLIGVRYYTVIMFLNGKAVGKTVEYYDNDYCEGYDKYSINSIT